MRISSYATNMNLFSQAQRLQAAYADVARQSSSGLRSENFDGIAPDAQRLLAITGDYNNLTAQSAVIKSAQLRVSTIQGSLDTINDTLNKVATFFVDIQSGINAADATPGYVAQAKTLRDSIVSTLNTQLGGDYIFGGSVYDRPPVNLTDPTYVGTSTTTADTNYYQGDQILDSARVSDPQRVTYGITADNPAFENAIRALQAYISSPTSATVITQATDLNKAAINQVTGLKGQILSQSNLINDASNANGVKSGYLEVSIVELRNVDIAQAATQMSQYETQLQASYSAFSKLLQLRLTDYLR